MTRVRSALQGTRVVRLLKTALLGDLYILEVTDGSRSEAAVHRARKDPSAFGVLSCFLHDPKFALGF
jgi:hypothetical protein